MASRTHALHGPDVPPSGQLLQAAKTLQQLEVAQLRMPPSRGRTAFDTVF